MNPVAQNPNNTNPNEYKVVEFKNITDFDFTPELGAMYDSRPFFVKAGETRSMPHPVGHRLAINLAKIIIVRQSPLPNYGGEDDKKSGNLYTDEDISNLVAKILTGEYETEKPVQQSETERLMQMYEALQKTVEELKNGGTAPAAPAVEASNAETPAESAPASYKDKAEVIAELNKRGITFDARKNKSELEKLLS